MKTFCSLKDTMKIMKRYRWGEIFLQSIHLIKTCTQNTFLNTLKNQIQINNSTFKKLKDQTRHFTPAENTDSK